MAKFSWTDDLYTRNALIDGDHHQLVDRVNALFEAMDSGEGNARISKAMNDLIACAEAHFGREQAEMERIEYVAALAHRGEHAKLIRQLVELRAMLERGGKINVPAVTDFLADWLRDHILTADMKLAAALRQCSAVTAAQAHW
ncbi:MAG: bacteriohemerythrin [Burkholderiales bacterium]